MTETAPRFRNLSSLRCKSSVSNVTDVSKLFVFSSRDIDVSNSRKYSNNIREKKKKKRIPNLIQ